MKNYNDVIQTLIDTNEKLFNDEISIDVAKQIANNVQVLINASRLQFDIMKYQEKKFSEYFPIDNAILLQRINKNCDLCRHSNLCKTSKKCKENSLEFFESS